MMHNHIYKYECIHTYRHIYKHSTPTHVHIHTLTDFNIIHTYICICTNTHTRTYIHIHTHIHSSYTHTNTHKHAHTRTHTYRHTHTHASHSVHMKGCATVWGFPWARWRVLQGKEWSLPGHTLRKRVGRGSPQQGRQHHSDCSLQDSVLVCPTLSPHPQLFLGPSIRARWIHTCFLFFAEDSRGHPTPTHIHNSTIQHAGVQGHDPH